VTTMLIEGAEGGNACKLIVTGQRSVQVTDVLGDHVQGLTKGAPGATGNGMGMADGLDVGAGLVHLRVDVEARVVGRARPVASHNLARVNVEAQHVAGVEQGKVLANGVHPHQMRELGVADTDVTGDALGEAHTCPITEDGSHVEGNVTTMLIEGAEGGNACKRVGATAQVSQSRALGKDGRLRLLLLLLLRPRGPQLEDWVLRLDDGGSSSGSHLG
jgi:hypothetical protein